MKTLLLLLVCASGLLSGCEPVHYYKRLEVATYPGNYHRKPYGTAAAFQTAADIKQPYTIIGMLSCEASAGEEAGILNAMLYRASHMGGDGILLGIPPVGGENLPGNSTYNLNLRSGWSTLLGNGNSDRRAYHCQVIRYTNNP